ncbi:MAG: type-F conjugative transfer system secretin TraK [Sulfurihydrogenibium azorense]|uniref:TraK domain-containing protein n=1 Tax=Sulfurihydrogenibium azorense TaxID=309806 RepID=UPI00391D0326
MFNRILLSAILSASFAFAEDLKTAKPVDNQSSNNSSGGQSTSQLSSDSSAKEKEESVKEKSKDVVYAGKGYFLYKIREGETLLSIAKENCITLEKIYKLNPKLKEKGYKAGEVITLYRPSSCKVTKKVSDKGYSLKAQEEKVKEEKKQESSITPLDETKKEPATKFDEIARKLADYSKVFEIEDDNGYKVVRIALKDINLVECKEPITGYSFSKEKNLIVKQSEDKKFLYVKVAPISIEDPDKDKPILKYEDYPREFYVECGGRSYSLVLVPEDIPSQKILIRPKPVSNSSESSSNTPEYLRNSPYENAILMLLKEIYTTPLSQIRYDYKPLKDVDKYQELDVVGVRVYFAGDYRVKEYVVISKREGRVDLHEALFLKYSKYPLAIMLTKPSLSKGESSTLYIVEKNVD